MVGWVIMIWFIPLICVLFLKQDKINDIYNVIFEMHNNSSNNLASSVSCVSIRAQKKRHMVMSSWSFDFKNNLDFKMKKINNKSCLSLIQNKIYLSIWKKSIHISGFKIFFHIEYEFICSWLKLLPTHKTRSPSIIVCLPR